MPELPEVETIRRGLDERIKDKRIANVVVENKKSFIGDPSLAIGKNVLSIERRAKLVIVRLENEQNLVFHLKMTGQLIFIDRSSRFAGGHPSHDWHAKLPNKYTRIIFTFHDGTNLYFNDLRKFGWCKLLNDAELKKIESTYGPEPFSPEFTVKYLQEAAIRFPNRKIKQFLMDQSIIAGIGNIYNDEALYAAKIMPTTAVSKLKHSDWEKVYKAVLNILTLGIKNGGTTDSDFVNVDGKIGGMQNFLKVYRKTGEPCECGGEIEKMKIGGRGTYFCQKCQKELK